MPTRKAQIQSRKPTGTYQRLCQMVSQQWPVMHLLCVLVASSLCVYGAVCHAVSEAGVSIYLSIAN